MNSIPKYQIGRPLPLARSYEMPWVKEARRKQMEEEKAYREDMNQPYYKTHPKPTKQQWKQQQAKRLQNQGEITAHREVSPLVRTINNYIREAKYRAGNGTLLLKGKYTLPAIAIASALPAMAAAPVTTAATMGSGYIGGKVVDGVSNILTGKDWAENMQDWTGLDPEAADITNPGVLVGGGAPLVNRGARTLLSVGDQIITNAGKDIVKYGPVAIIRNPQGWYRPYVDQVRNGWQGWKDMRLAQQNGAIRRDINKPYFESFAKRSGKYDGIYDTDYGEIKLYDYPNYSEGIGDRVYAHFDKEGVGKMAVSQTENTPNTYLFHIGGGGTKGSIDRASQLTLGRMRAAVPKYSYIGETTTPSTGQIGMTFVVQKGRTPTLGELIRASKMSETTTQPLSANSANILMSGKNGQLRYTNQYMSNFNEQSLVGSNGVTRELINNPNLSTINNFIQQSNPNTRKAFIGLDGKLKMSIPINFKIK